MTRRDLLCVGAVASAPMFVPRRVLGGRGQPGANDRIRLGVIGVGGRSNLLIDQLPPGAELVAVADCYLKRAQESAAKRKANWRIYQHHLKLLEQKDIDGVIVGTKEHQRVIPCIHACQAGKDVYAEKPLTLYPAEGRALVRAARRYNRVFQVGSQQRSMAMNQVACEFVRSGKLGKVLFVQGINYTGPSAEREWPPTPIPDNFDWDLWLNQCAMRPYSRYLHGGPGTREFSGGEMTNWGAHGLDQIQSALGKDLTGPVEIWPLADGPKNSIGYRYADGTLVRLELPPGTGIEGGCVVVGEKGIMQIVRNGLRTDPPGLVKELPPQEEVDKWNRAQWQAQYHIQEWMDCMRTRKQPSADIEIGQRTTTVCQLALLAREMNRKIRWDPETERVIDDPEAAARLVRVRRKGYELPADLA
jgi:predicted dehydrogenase